MINCREQYLLFLKEESLTKEELSYPIYTSIIKMHNKEVMKQIIIDNKYFNMGFQLGNIMAIERDNKIKTSKNGRLYTSINWFESNKKREELISKGVTPLKMEKDEQGKIISDNGGEEWLIYTLLENKPVFYWSRYRVKRNNKDYYPLQFIRNYQLRFVPKNIKMLYSAFFNDNIRYDKLGL